MGRHEPRSAQDASRQPNLIAMSTSSSSPPTSNVRLFTTPLTRFPTHTHRAHAHTHRASFHHLRFRHRPARHPGHPKPTLDPDTQARRSKHRAETCRHGQSGTQQVAQRAHRRPYVSLPRPSCVRLTTTTPQVRDLYIVLYDAILDGRAGHGRDGL